jgi:hypothetical protein
MENSNSPNEEELSEMISQLIEMGAMEILGYDSVSDQFTYKITPECKEIYPELYYSHYEAIGEIAYQLWMRDIVDIVFHEGETVVGLTPEQMENIKKNILNFDEDERFFLETILNYYEQN